MSKMIIYFCLFIPLLFLSTDSSSIRGRNHKNDLVPFSSSRLDTLKKDPNSMKIVSKEPFIIQLHMPNPKETEARAAKEKNKNKKPVKKRVSKIKPLRKRHRKRRDLVTSKTKSRDEKLIRFKIPHAANETTTQLKNISNKFVNRMEILRALSSYPKKVEIERNKLEGIRNIEDDGKVNTEKTKKNNTSNRSLNKHHLSLSNRTKMVYPSTPKLDRHSQKYTYKDLMADRERLEQKLKYIKNLLNANDSTTNDSVRVRRRSDSDRTANKIAKMFLTLSAVNGLHDRKKSKCNDADDNDDRVEDVWEKERKNNSHFRRSKSSNEERYKVKKWIEFMKNKRSSTKTCPCLGNSYNEENDAFPLEQKLAKGNFLIEKGISSEESSELYGNPFYYSKDKLNRNDNVKKRLTKSQEQDAKIKAPSKNGKKKLELPFEDLELYRSRARQILQNAEEILDKIKEEEEKRLAAPNVFINQLKELTSKIHGGPRNNENDLIRIIQKNLGWGPLTKFEDNTNKTILDNVKSFILDPYEKAKALTDESTKKLSSYLLQNLGILQDSSEEKEMKNPHDESLSIYFEEIPQGKEELTSASLAKEEPRTDILSKDKEDLQNWEETLSAILGGGGDDAINKETDWDIHPAEPSQQVTEDTVEIEDKVKQEELNTNKDQSTKETETASKIESMGNLQSDTETVADSKPKSFLEEERVEMKLYEKETNENNQNNVESQATSKKEEKGNKSFEVPEATTVKTLEDSDIAKSNNFREMEKTFQGKKEENNVKASRDMQEEEEFEREIEEIKKSITGNENNSKGLKADEEVVQNSGLDINEQKITNEDVAENLGKQNDENDKEKGKGNNTEIVGVLPELEEIPLEEVKPEDSITEERVEKKTDISTPLISLVDKAPPNDSGVGSSIEDEKISKETVKANFREDDDLKQQQKLDGKQTEEELEVEQDFRKVADPEAKKESPLVSKELLKENDKEHGQDNDEITQKESSAKTLPEYADLIQEAEQRSKEFLEMNPNESELGNTKSSEILNDLVRKADYEKNQHGESTYGEDADGDTLKAVLDNEGNSKTLEEKNSPKEDSTKETNTPLRKTLENQDNLNESLSPQEGSSKENDDYALLQDTYSDEHQKETLEEDINDEFLEETLENKSQEILSEEKNYDTSLSAEENIESQSIVKSTENYETHLQETNPEKEVSENAHEEGTETFLRAFMNNQDPNSGIEDANETKEYKKNEVSEEGGNLNEENGNETSLKASLDKNEGIINHEITFKANSFNDDEKDDKNQETSLNSAVSTENETQRKDQENSEERGSTETSLGRVLNAQERESLTKGYEQTITSKESNYAETINENADVKTILQTGNPDENLNIEDKETNRESLKTLSSSEIEYPKGSNNEETLRETNLDEDIQDEKHENSKEKSSYEILKVILENQKQKSLLTGDDEVNQDGLLSDKPSEDGNLKEVFENDPPENLEERPDKGILAAVKLEDDSEGNEPLEATIRNQDDKEKSKDGLDLKEITKESEENLNNSDKVGEISENQELQSDENEQNFNEDKDKRNEKDIDEKILLSDEDVNKKNSNDDTLILVSSEQDQKNFKENYENLQAENPTEDREKESKGETLLKSVGVEDGFDNKIENDSPLKSTQSTVGTDKVEPVKNIHGDESEESERAENIFHDLNKQTDQENEDDDVLRSIHFDSDTDSDLNEPNRETIREENLQTENKSILKSSNHGGKNSQENLQESGQLSFIEDSQKLDSPSKSLKASKLRVPHSIGKIMKDLEGKEKIDITSIQHLNPDKIDHMLDKIGEAEQQNLLESQEVDCRKECACAEEMNTRSRNIGRYEIVKDFLQWVKDLQLNRVLSDD